MGLPTPLMLFPFWVLCFAAGNFGGKSAFPAGSSFRLCVPGSCVLALCAEQRFSEQEGDEERTVPTGLTGQSSVPSVLLRFGIFGKRKS